ncbi:MAG: hypothetical protein ACP5PW_08905, partial [Candidatus Dormibacteria bacterium]
MKEAAGPTPVVAVDLGGTWLRVAPFDEAGEMGRTIRVPTPAEHDTGGRPIAQLRRTTGVGDGLGRQPQGHQLVGL